MQSGTYIVTHITTLRSGKITKIKDLLAAIGNEPTNMIIHIKSGGSPMFLGGAHKDGDKVTLVGMGPDSGTSAVLRQVGRKLKMDVS